MRWVLWGGGEEGDMWVAMGVGREGGGGGLARVNCIFLIAGMGARGTWGGG